MNRPFVNVFVAGEGYIPRSFRNKGDAVAYLNKKYGPDWRKLRLRFENGVNHRSFDGFPHEKHEIPGFIR